jgi:hypothetical protein
MYDIKITSFVGDDQTTFDNELLPVVKGWRIFSHWYAAFCSSTGCPAEDLFAACCEQSREFRLELYKSGYRLYFLHVGPHHEDRSARVSTYKVSSVLVDENIKILDSIEIERPYKNRDRSIGLYEIGEADFVNGCHLQSVQTWSIMIFSTRHLISAMAIDEMYRAIRADLESDLDCPLGSFDWRPLVTLLCPRGDVVVKTAGRFDDRDRIVAYLQKANE